MKKISRLGSLCCSIAGVWLMLCLVSLPYCERAVIIHVNYCLDKKSHTPIDSNRESPCEETGAETDDHPDDSMAMTAPAIFSPFAIFTITHATLARVPVGPGVSSSVPIYLSTRTLII